MRCSLAAATIIALALTTILIAEEPGRGGGHLVDALMVGQWVAFSPDAESYRFDVVRRPDGMTLEEFRSRQQQAREELQALQRRIEQPPPTRVERDKRTAELADELSAARLKLGPRQPVFEVRSVEADHVVLRNDKSDFLVPFSKIRLITRDSTDSKLGGSVESEVHLVSLYQGFQKAGQSIANVAVNRPGKRVTLVLTAYSSIDWQVSIGEGTLIDKVVLGGYELQTLHGVPASTNIVDASRNRTEDWLYYAYQQHSMQFRRLIRDVYRRTHADLASFHGAYEASSDGPIKIDSVQKNPVLSIQYPLPIAKADWPAEADQIKFAAHFYQVGSRQHDVTASFGEFTPAGPNEESLRPLPHGVRRVTKDSRTGRRFGIEGHEFVELLSDGRTAPIAVPADVPELSWPCEVTFDTKRRQVVLGTSGGGGYLYAYLVDEGSWSVIATRPAGLDAFAYSSDEDCLYGVAFEHSEAGSVASLRRVNMHGAVTASIPLGDPIVPGSLNTGPGVATTGVAMAGKYVAILSSPGGMDERNLADGWYIYLVDPTTGESWLTSKRIDPVSTRRRASSGVGWFNHAFGRK